MMRLAAWFIRFAYFVCALFPRRDKVSFLSRQSSRPFDFALLEPEIRRSLPGYDIVWSCVPESGSFGPLLAFRQVWHAATSRVCIVDGYVPAVSVPKSHEGALCVQLWHALGAMKRFGYQALDTPDGRSSKAASALRMHRGYDMVVAGLPGAVPAFAEAFDCSEKRILPLGLPRVDYLLSSEFEDERARRQRAAVERLDIDRDRWRAVVLYAPTLRRGVAGGDAWFDRSTEELTRAFGEIDAALVVAGHPLQADVQHDGGNVAFLRGAASIDVLSWVDYVVTDYSAVAFEAAVASKKVLFYVPDIEEYRRSPGLNVDPLEEYPQLSFKDADSLASAVASDIRTDGSKVRPFDECAKAYLGDLRQGCMKRIVAEVASAAGACSKTVGDDDGFARAAL